MGMARYVVDAVLLEGRSAREVARAHGISKTPELIWELCFKANQRAAWPLLMLCDDEALTPQDAPDAREGGNDFMGLGKVVGDRGSRLYKIGLGRAHKGRVIRLLIADLNVRVIDANGELIRELTLDPSRIYQPLSDRSRVQDVPTHMSGMS